MYVHADHHQSQTNSQIATIQTCTSATSADSGSQVSIVPFSGWIHTVLVHALTSVGYACF